MSNCTCPACLAKVEQRIKLKEVSPDDVLIYRCPPITHEQRLILLEEMRKVPNRIILLPESHSMEKADITTLKELREVVNTAIYDLENKR